MRHVEIVNGHWMWTGSVIKNNGYGVVTAEGSTREKRKTITAHRRAYELFVGPIPDGVCVLHKHEGIQLCVNPDHLCLGSSVDNAAAYRQTALVGFQVLEKIRVSMEELRKNPESGDLLAELESLLK